MRAQLLHLSGPLRGKTVIHSERKVVLGSDPSSLVCYHGSETVKPRHAELTYFEDACAFHLKALEGEVFVNHAQIREVVLEPEDLVEIGRDGPKFRFFIHLTPGKVCKPVRRMLTDARDVATSSGFRAATQTIRRDLIHHATPRLKLGVVATILVAVFVVAYVGGWLGAAETEKRVAGRTRPGDLRLAKLERLFDEALARLQKQNEEFGKQRLKERLQDKASLEKLRRDLDEKTAVVDRLVKQNSDLKKVLDVYSKGVCLLHGRYTFMVERDGKKVPVTDSDGDPVEIEYVGSGFLTSDQGQVITNRHVAQPWWRNTPVDRLLKKGLIPEFISLTAIFPGKLPVPVDTSTIKLSKEAVDVALLQVKVDDVPVLPLHKGNVLKLRGGRVVLIGYPTGMHAIMARTDPEVMKEVMDIAKDMTSLISELARRNVIRPVITQGSLNDVDADRLVYDAETTSGGSGGPVFGQGGDVIGINFAITKDFDGSNFGVPIGFARTLLAQD